MSTPENEKPGTNSPALSVAFDGLKRVIDESATRIHKNLFAMHFLQPLINNNRQVFLDNWMELTGALQRPISVIDDDGSIMETFPSIYSALSTQFTESGKDSLAHIGMVADQRSQLSPRLADVFLEDKLSARQTTITGQFSAMQRWNDLTRRIGGPDADLPFPMIAPKQESSGGDTPGDAAAEGRPKFLDLDEDEDY